MAKPADGEAVKYDLRLADVFAEQDAPAMPLTSTRWTSTLAALTAALACAAPAAADHGSGELRPTVSDETVTGVEGSVVRHGDPRSEFKAGYDDPTQPDAAVAAAALPGTCPSVDRTTDDAHNSPNGAGVPVVKVIYAHPVNVGNRLPTYGPVIEAGAKAIADFATSESGGALSVRFDIGTFEGPHCVDIQRVALPQTAAYYSSPAGDAFPKVGNDVFARLGPQPGVRNFLIYADGVTPSGVAGEAEALIGPAYDDPGSAAAHNGGGLFAAVYGHDGTDFLGSGVGFGPGQTSRRHLEIAMHELTHTLGAVQTTAPRSSGIAPGGTPAGHCNDQYDLMCYEDGGSGMLFVDPACDGAATPPSDPYGPSFQAWDCNKDDYFAVNPAGGSYLDTHWNTADSAFLCAFAACAPPDGQAPEITVTKKPRKRSARRKVRIEFTVTERSEVRCRIDRRKPRPCDSPYKKRVKPGRHTVKITATDAAGLSDPDPPKVRFKVIRAR